MALADHAYRVRPASAADLPAVLRILAENRAERPHGTARATGEPSDHEKVAWERAASCRKIQLLSHKRHSNDGAHHLYQALGFAPEAEGFRLYLDP